MASCFGCTRRLAARALPALGAALLLLPAPARALTFQFTYDSSYNALPSNQKTQIGNALNTVASEYSAAISNNITVNIQIGWGTAAGSAIPANDIGYTLENYQSTTYANLKNYLSSFGGVLPASNPTNTANTFLPTAEAKALGIGTTASIDGYLGFSSTVQWTFDDAGGVAANTYDFLAVAKQEIGHVLGRISYLPTDSTSTAIAAYPLDFFRYSGVGLSNYTFGTAAYLSIDGGKTSLGQLDDTGADNSDWLNGVNCATVSRTVVLDAANATICAGNVATLSSQDLGVLHALGYTITGNTAGLASNAVTPYGATLVPEPGGLPVLALAGIGLGLLRRRRLAPSPPAA